MPQIFLNARWENLIMANYAVDPLALAPYLPKGVEVDLFEGKSYVSLVGFIFKPTHFFNVPIPFPFSFEEINLRFYVSRKVADETRRGVVFINETVPLRPIAWVANMLYKEHYATVPTSYSTDVSEAGKHIRYEWKVNNKWDHLSVLFADEIREMKAGSLEEFIFEHYYGYTRIDERVSQEYRIHHPRWKVHQVLDHAVHCDFTAMYGKSFSFLQDVAPDAVFLAQGSPVAINWKRSKF